MKCNLCGNGHATVHLTQNVGNLAMIQVDLCRPCADRLAVSELTGFSMESVLAALEEAQLTLPLTLRKPLRSRPH